MIKLELHKDWYFFLFWKMMTSHENQELCTLNERLWAHVRNLTFFNKQTRVHCQSVERVFIFTITESYLRNPYDIRQKLSKIVYKIKHSVPCPKTSLLRNSVLDTATKTNHKKAQFELVSPCTKFNFVHFSPGDTNSIWKTQLEQIFFSRENLGSTQPKVTVFFFFFCCSYFLLLLP